MPDHLPVAAALPHIRPVTTRLFMGMYLIQVRTFPQQVAEQDLPALLNHTEEILRANGVVLNQPDPDAADQNDVGNPAMTPAHGFLLSNDHGRNLQDFVIPIVDRILESEHAAAHMARIARILLWFLPSSERMPLPAAVDLIDAAGTEPAPTTTLRRQLTEELIRAAQTNSAPNHHDYWISEVGFSHWGHPLPSADRGLPPGTQRANRTRLLDSGDADWATARSQHYNATGDPDMAETFARLATAFANTGPIVAAEPSELDISEPEWEQSDALATMQRQRLKHAAAGDPAAFWQLVKDLMANPKTGHYELIISWDVSSYPGAVLWPETELRNQLRVAAGHYLSTEHDHHPEWLGTANTDWRAYAGYFALATLHTAGQDTDTPGTGLAAVPDERWSAWVGAIVHFAGHFGAAPDLARELLSRATLHAPAELTTAVEQCVRTHLAHANTPLYLPHFPSQLTPTLTILAGELYTALRAATPDPSPDVAPAEPSVVTDGPITVAASSSARDAAVITWTHLLHQPVHTGDPTATELCQKAIADHTTQPNTAIGLKLAVAAGYSLLTADPTHHWPAIYDAITGSEAFARDLAFACASDESDTATITEAVPEAALGQLYRWLATVCPPETDILKAGFGFIGPERRVHDWRRTTMSTLAAHATPEAVHQLRRLADEDPERLDLQAALLDARHGAQVAAVRHLTPDQVTALLNDPTRRIVHTAGQLAGVVIETLDHIAADLHTHGNLLWDCERLMPPEGAPKGTRRESVWRPKLEGALSSYLGHELALRLERRGIVVNREVVVRPTDAGDSGERPDIVIEATTLDVPTAEASIVSVPLEIKGAWHKQVLTAQDTQLAQRYILDMNTSADVYLVGWYPLDQWTALGDSNPKSKANRFGSSANLLSRLRRQADTIRSTTGRSTYPYVLTIPRAASRT